MPRMSTAEVIAYNARRFAGQPSQTPPSASRERESVLHKQILDECKRRGWIVFHGSMAHSTFRTPGEPDFVILAEGGKTILVEAKNRCGKMTPDQLAIQTWACKLGHFVHVVRSFEEFLDLVSPS